MVHNVTCACIPNVYLIFCYHSNSINSIISKSFIWKSHLVAAMPNFKLPPSQLCSWLLGRRMIKLAFAKIDMANHWRRGNHTMTRMQISLFYNVSFVPVGFPTGEGLASGSGIKLFTKGIWRCSSSSILFNNNGRLVGGRTAVFAQWEHEGIHAVSDIHAGRGFNY